ncbi:hypothetical protein [Limnoraphis robusta]|nr:hypothetical protein [Limnoraphis robusta]
MSIMITPMSTPVRFISRRRADGATVAIAANLNRFSGNCWGL